MARSAALSLHLGLVARGKVVGPENISIGGWLKIDTTKIGEDRWRHAERRAQGATRGGEEAFGADHRRGSSRLRQRRRRVRHDGHQVGPRPDESARGRQPDAGDRDKLRLVNTTGAPFYGSSIQRMLELDRDFIVYVLGLVELPRPDLVWKSARGVSSLDEATMHQWYEK